MRAIKAIILILALTIPGVAFALSDASTPPKFPIPWGNSAGAGFIRTIPTASQIGITPGAASLTDGFPPVTFSPVAAGGTPPFGQDFNGILKQITQWNQWQAAGGPVMYDSSFSSSIGGYPKNAVLANATTTGCFWISTVDNNSSNPDSGGANWSGYCVGVAPNITTLTSGSGTYTTPANATWLRVKIIGGGGGGASGGPGGGPGGNPGTAGTATSFGTISMGPGQFGQNLGFQSNGGAGGTASGVPAGNPSFSGGSGTSGGGDEGKASVGGVGGSSCVGGGGGGGSFDTSGILAGFAGAANTGAGGGGGGTDVTSNNIAGGGGGAGACADVIISSPAATYSYTVGAGGIGNLNNGTSAGVGGNGGSGIVIIEAHFGG